MNRKHFQIKLINAIPSATHALAALIPLLWWSAQRGFFSPVLIVGAIVIGNLPDIDSASSHVGYLAYPLAKRIETRFGHRDVTHSLLAAAIVAALSYAIHLTICTLAACTLADLPPWWWWPVFYLSHLLLDMLVGGVTGVPLFWPSKKKFWFGIDIKAGSTGERIVFLLLLASCLLPLFINPTALSPSRILRQTTGSVEMALYDYRQWEATHEVELEIEGTWQRDRTPISGRFIVHHVEGATFHLQNPENGTRFTAGQYGDTDVYLTRAVARQVEQRVSATVTPTPGPSPTPRSLVIQVDSITDPGTQILVHPGDHVEPGVTLAVLPTAIPQPTPTPWTPDPFAVAQAEAELAVAEAQYDVAMQYTPVDPITVLYAQAQILQIQAQITDLEIRRDEGKLRHERGIEALQARLIAAEAYLQQLEESGGRGPTWQERQLAEAQLTHARLVYSATIATPTPAPPVPPPPAHTVDAVVTGQVREVYVSHVNPADNTATVSIVVVAEFSIEGTAAVATSATVAHVTDGDTIGIVWPSGAQATVRLIGVDTPETVRPDEPIECYGPEASDYTKSLLPEGTQVSLEFDRQHLDPYGRTLAYVYLDDGRMLNALLLENGYGRVLIISPNDHYAAMFYSLEDQAKANETGLWGACP